MHGLAGLGDRLQELLGVRAEGATGRRQCETGAPTLEEGDTERLLERLDPRAHRRLGQPESLRRPAESAERAHRQERFHLTDLHDHILLSGL
jgi:hypothetical protein